MGIVLLFIIVLIIILYNLPVKNRTMDSPGFDSHFLSNLWKNIETFYLFHLLKVIYYKDPGDWGSSKTEKLICRVLSPSIFFTIGFCSMFDIWNAHHSSIAAICYFIVGLFCWVKAYKDLKKYIISCSKSNVERQHTASTVKPSKNESGNTSFTLIIVFIVLSFFIGGVHGGIIGIICFGIYKYCLGKYNNLN